VLCFQRSKGKEHFQKHSGNTRQGRGNYFSFKKSPIFVEENALFVREKKSHKFYQLPPFYIL